jgi:hypothetical protein
VRLQESRKQIVTLRPLLGGDDAPIWGAGTVIRAVIQPLSGQIAANLYGERLTRMKLLLYDGVEVFTEGAGVCVEAAGTASCDYRIVSCEGWAGHQRAHIEWIPESRRA